MANEEIARLYAGVRAGNALALASLEGLTRSDPAAEFTTDYVLTRINANAALQLARRFQQLGH